jgi:spore coat polysaccharide biosynthesis protein SpsF
MGSTRLPGKVLMAIGASPLLGHVVGRLEMSRIGVRPVVATTDTKRDDAIADWCAGQGVACFRGSEEDVLARYHDCAVEHGFDTVVRLTADNPFTDIAEMDRLIVLHDREENSFTHSFAALPVGVGAEVFSLAALRQSYRDGHAAHHREHVDEYMIENPQIFKTGTLTVPESKNRPDIRLTVDTADDYRRACFVADNAAGKWATTEEAIALCSRFA